jgi:ADP-ribosylation factor GTPase-activating protein 1
VVQKSSEIVHDPSIQGAANRTMNQVGNLLTKVGETAMTTGTRAYQMLETQVGTTARSQQGYATVFNQDQQQRFGSGSPLSYDNTSPSDRSLLYENPSIGDFASPNSGQASANFPSNPSGLAQGANMQPSGGPTANLQNNPGGPVFGSQSIQPHSAAVPSTTPAAGSSVPQPKNDDWDSW